MLQLFAIQKGEVREEKPDISVAKSLVKKADVCWIDMVEPSDEELNQVCSFIGIEAKHLEELFHSKDPQRKKRGSHVLIHVPIMRFEPGFHSFPLVFVAVSNAFLTYRERTSDHIIEDALTSVQNSLQLGEKVAAGFIACRILDGVCDDNFNVIRHVRKMVEQLEVDAITAVSKDILLEVFAARRHIDEIRDVLVGEREIIDAIREGAIPYVSLDERNRAIIADSHAEIGEHMSFLQTYEGALLAAISIRDLELTTRMTKIVTYLTVAATVLLLPNTLATIFGIPSLPIDAESTVFSIGGIKAHFWHIMIIAIVLSTVAPLVWIMKKGWAKI